METRRRPSPGDIAFAVVAVLLAATIHGPVGELLAGALAPTGAGPLAAIPFALAWLASGAILAGALLSGVWLLMAAWRGRRR